MQPCLGKQQQHVPHPLPQGTDGSAPPPASALAGLLVLPHSVSPRQLASPRDSRALRDALLEQLGSAPALVQLKQNPQVGWRPRQALRLPVHPPAGLHLCQPQQRRAQLWRAWAGAQAGPRHRRRTTPQHAQATPTAAPPLAAQVAEMLGLLPPELRELRLLGLRQLADRDLAALCRFTRLRELALNSIGNERVSHAALRVRGGGGGGGGGGACRGRLASAAAPAERGRLAWRAALRARPAAADPCSLPTPAAPRSPWRRCGGWRCCCGRWATCLSSSRTRPRWRS